jgi:putative membrane protein
MFSNPSVELGALGVVLIYAAAARYTGQRFQAYQSIALSAAMVIVILSLDGPIDALEDARLFTAHMIQHLILALVIPPLILLGTPDWMVRPLLRVRGMRPVLRFLTQPLAAYIIYNLILVGLHSPQVYDLMCRNENIHVLMHLTLLGSAMLLWWPLLSPLPELPRLSYPAQMLYLFFWLIPMAAIAAPITMAQSVIYPWYLEGPHPFGLSATADQVLGGLVMWVGAGFYMIGVFTTIYFQWAQREDLDEPKLNLQMSGASHAGISKRETLQGEPIKRVHFGRQSSHNQRLRLWN